MQNFLRKTTTDPYGKKNGAHYQSVTPSISICNQPDGCIIKLFLISNFLRNSSQQQLLLQLKALTSKVVHSNFYF